MTRYTLNDDNTGVPFTAGDMENTPHETAAKWIESLNKDETESLVITVDDTDTWDEVFEWVSEHEQVVFVWCRTEARELLWVEKVED